MTVNTKTYVEEPIRSNDGSIPNINDYATFIVPRCKVNFKYFNIQDYQRLCEAVQSNEFIVKYYDKQFNEFVSHKMYCEPEEMAKLYNVGIDVFGVLDYEVSFIGTLNDMQQFYVSYDSNGGNIVGNPQLYNSEQYYSKGDRVYLADNRYFEAIFYENSFKNDEGNIELTDSRYWQNHPLYEYSETNYVLGDVVYKDIIDSNGEQKGRKYYIAIKDVPSDRPLTDTEYWKPISAKVYNTETTYSSKKSSYEDSVLGDFALNSDATSIYQAIYYDDQFTGIDPTNSTYWKQLALGNGISVPWGKSIVIPDPVELFEAPSGKSANKWVSYGGYTYYPGQSLNVFRNLTLYAEWE